MDQKKLLAIVAVVVLLLLGGGAYMMSQSGQSSDSTVNDSVNDKNVMMEKTQPTTDTTTPPDGAKSIFDLLSMTGSQQCTFSLDQDGSKMESVAYINDKKVRTDVSIVANGAEQKMHMIVDDQVAYTWIDGMPNGFKVSAEMMKEQVETPTNVPGAGQMPDFNQDVNYDCKPWIVDNTLLTPPADVMFIDMGQFKQ